MSSAPYLYRCYRIMYPLTGAETEIQRGKSLPSVQATEMLGMHDFLSQPKFQMPLLELSEIPWLPG